MTLQIVEKSGEGLSRVYGVTVPAADLNERLDARIREITPRIQLKGFRPGKVPPAHVRKMYGKGLMQEIVEQTLTESQQQALDQAKLRPAGSPDLKLDSDIEAVLDGKADLAFELAVEIMPEFEPVDVTTLELTRPVHEPADAEVDEQIAEIAAQNRTYEAKTGKAKDGDMVVADFVGRIDGEAFAGGSGEDAEIVIGSNRFIPGFEEQLTGAKAGDTVTVKVAFPDDYPVDTLKGRPAEFEVTVKEVRAAKEGVADDALAERLGLSDLEGLKAAVKAQIAGQYEQASRYKLKRALLDVLDSSHDFPLPPRMVETEFQAIWRQVEQDRAQGELSEEDSGKDETQLQAEYRRIAERRVRLGLVLAEIGRSHDVQVTNSELQAAINAEARRYPGQEQQVWEAYQRPEFQASLRAPIYEEKVVDLIVSKAKVADKTVSKDELFAEDDLPEGYAEAEEKPAKKPAAKKAKAEAAPAEEKPAKKAKKAEAAEEAPAAEEKPAKKKAAPKKKAEE